MKIAYILLIISAFAILAMCLYSSYVDKLAMFASLKGNNGAVSLKEIGEMFSNTAISENTSVIMTDRIDDDVTVPVTNQNIEEKSSSQSTDMKTILLYTSTWYDKDAIGQQMFITRGCSQQNCVLTKDKKKVKEADMLVFHLNNLELENLAWPKERLGHQLYVHTLTERPSILQSWMINYDGKINLTANYRFDADIPLRKSVVSKPNSSEAEPYKPRIPFRNKTSLVVWPVSHCTTPSGRENYVRELRKYIDVDIIGKCGMDICPWTKPGVCYDEWEKQYKFYLSFENSICNDYMTEKVYNPLRWELVPVVLGGGNYKRDTPPHSVINVRDYRDPKDLADYLIYLSKHEDKYNEYFQWKPRYEIKGGRLREICALCEAAHKKEFLEGKPVHDDYYDWWFRGCDNTLLNNMKRHLK